MKSFKILLVLAILTNSLKGQIFDSISYKPYPNVDSIEYWHSIEIMDNNKSYFTNGYFLNCNCDYHVFLKESNHKSRQKIIISEGIMEADKKAGEWVYWNNVIGKCCDELLLYPDSTVTYKFGLRTKKVDTKATYFFNDKDSIIINPFYDTKEFQYQIICTKGQCKAYVNEKYIIKEFSQDFLDMELSMLLNDEYNLLSRKILEQ